MLTILSASQPKKQPPVPMPGENLALLGVPRGVLVFNPHVTLLGHFSMTTLTALDFCPHKLTLQNMSQLL